jgi:hypothetical protein
MENGTGIGREARTWLKVVGWLVLACAAIAVWYQARMNGEGIGRAVEAAEQYEQLAAEWRAEALEQNRERQRAERPRLVGTVGLLNLPTEGGNVELRAEVERLGVQVDALSLRWTDAEQRAERDLAHYAELTTPPTCTAALSSCTEARRAASALIEGQREQVDGLNRQVQGLTELNGYLRAEAAALDSAATNAERRAGRLAEALAYARRPPLGLPDLPPVVAALPVPMAAERPRLVGTVGLLNLPTEGVVDGARVTGSVAVAWRGWSVGGGGFVDVGTGRVLPLISVQRRVFAW